MQAVSNYPAKYDFASDGLSAEELQLLGWADSRIFSNPAFLASKWGPDNWPDKFKVESAQAIILLMREIEIENRADGRHVIDWEADSLDRILDELGIYEGMCTSCYGKDNYGTQQEVRRNYAPIVLDPGHVHREMLKTFAYFVMADEAGILYRSFMRNTAGDLDLLYQRDVKASAYGGQRHGNSLTLTSFGWRSLSFMNQIRLPDGRVESFPTTVYKVIGDAVDEREAVERWFAYIHRNMWHYSGGKEDFANIYRPYSQTPYTPEPGYLLMVGEAGSPASTGMTTSAFRAIGLKAEQFLSPEKGRRTGAVELGGKWYYHNGNSPLSSTGPEASDLEEIKFFPLCVFLAPLDAVEDYHFEENCGSDWRPLWSTVRLQEPAWAPSPDRQTLVSIYNALGGENWTRKRNWLSDRPISEWYGVTTFNGRVTRLALWNNNLTGKLPVELGSLVNLNGLMLRGNQLTGCIPGVFRERISSRSGGPGVPYCDQ